MSTKPWEARRAGSLHTGGAFGGAAYLRIDQGVVSVHPTRWAGAGPVPPVPPPQLPIVHVGRNVDVFHARWMGNGSVLVAAAERTYVVTLSSWRTIEREVIPAMRAAGLTVTVRTTRFRYGTDLAAARFFPGLIKPDGRSADDQ